VCDDVISTSHYIVKRTFADAMPTAATALDTLISVFSVLLSRTTRVGVVVAAVMASGDIVVVDVAAPVAVGSVVGDVVAVVVVVLDDDDVVVAVVIGAVVLCDVGVDVDVGA